MAYDPIVLTVYDLITAKLAAVLPDHWRLPNPYDPASNSWLKPNCDSIALIEFQQLGQHSIPIAVSAA